MRIFTTAQQESFPEKGFHIVNSGYDKSISKFVWKLSRTRQDYYLVTVTQGAVEYWLENNSFKLKEGDFFLYFPGDKQKFVFDTYIHTTTHWVHFVGDEADSLINELQLSRGKINVKTEQPKKLLLRIINESILKNPHYELIAKGLLFELLATLAREDFESKRKSDVISHKFCQCAVILIHPFLRDAHPKPNAGNLIYPCNHGHTSPSLQYVQFYHKFPGLSMKHPANRGKVSGDNDFILSHFNKSALQRAKLMV